ncbi:hypothetical protein [Paenibacillus chitinolyticus]
MLINRKRIKEEMDIIIFVAIIVALIALLVIMSIKETKACEERGGEMIETGSYTTYISHTTGDLTITTPIENTIYGCSLEE